MHSIHVHLSNAKIHRKFIINLHIKHTNLLF